MEFDVGTILTALGIVATAGTAIVGWAWKIASYLSSIATEVKAFATFREKTEEHQHDQHKINRDHHARLVKVETKVEQHAETLHEIKERK